MTGVAGERVSPSLPQPSFGSSMPPPVQHFGGPAALSAMPPPMPGTGLTSRRSHPAPGQVPVAPAAVNRGREKSVLIAYLLWLSFGVVGAHHFYLGKAGRGVGYLLTCAWLTIGLWVDLFTLPGQVRRLNAERRAALR